MARRQMQIPGTERTDVPQSILDAGEEWLEARREKRRAKEKAEEAELAVLALMDANKVPVFTVKDPETDEVMTLKLTTKTKLSTKRSAEDEPDDAEVVEDGDATPHDEVKPGLIEMAARSMDDANVSETLDGDVIPPEKPAAKRAPKRKGKGGKKGKAS